MYALVDCMFIKGLKGLYKRKVEQELLLQLNASSFPSVIVEIYKSTLSQDRGLRDLVVRVTMHLSRVAVQADYLLLDQKVTMIRP
ncbi:uncharacterized protein BJX67DRAFT_344114 [Aspergillus lucknowensis]|uniref:Uncharacterized protein n=1 Tax=Aspergillus lucknowensis TaxID=176173 RepID=A0ABR4M2X8_9EURO